MTVEDLFALNPSIIWKVKGYSPYYDMISTDEIPEDSLFFEDYSASSIINTYDDFTIFSGDPEYIDGNASKVNNNGAGFARGYSLTNSPSSPSAWIPEDWLPSACESTASHFKSPSHIPPLIGDLPLEYPELSISKPKAPRISHGEGRKNGEMETASEESTERDASSSKTRVTISNDRRTLISAAPGYSSPKKSEQVNLKCAPKSYSAIKLQTGAHISETKYKTLSAPTSRVCDLFDENEDSSMKQLCGAMEESQLTDVENAGYLIDSAKEAVLDVVMEEFWVLFDQNWVLPLTEHGGNNGQGSSTTDRSESSSAATRSSNGSVKRKRRGSSGSMEDDDDGSNEGTPPLRKNSKMNPNDDPISKFSCPFRKRDPRRYGIYTHRTCTQGYWTTMARLKEHLYRCHQTPLHCKRCGKVFKSQPLLDMHIVADVTEICRVIQGSAPAGVTPENELKLRSKKKSRPGMTEKERWEDIYRILFPDEAIPSPYFEEPQDEVPSSPDSQNLTIYTEYLRRELPRMVRAEIEESLRHQMQPVQTALLAGLVDTMRECQDRLFRSFADQQGQPSGQPQDTSNEESSFADLGPTKSGEDIGDNKTQGQTTADTGQSDLLNASFLQPPPTEELDLDQFLFSCEDRTSTSAPMISSDSAYESALGFISEQQDQDGDDGPEVDVNRRNTNYDNCEKTGCAEDFTWEFNDNYLAGFQLGF
ncbi:hypothetical protein BJ875DRAFT_454343 [Amylocarpus encephaloides]|uniref:C2H2-type domain-containing protein n=1 Tax=Amylocarpus encephaloides TaxID=45428 RepID=A0A9P7YNT9_9HELO|nr:hypothetical protein BJ875DRAFT_454343 [Amylocarpus encephaloides]